MNAATLTPDLALRIGLAARALPETEPRRLMEALIDAVGLPLTELKLSALRLRDLREAAGGDFADTPAEPMKLALRYLKGELAVEVGEDDVPVVEAVADNDPGAVLVAVASNSGERLDGHFGSCRRFLVYSVSPTALRLVDVRSAAGEGDIDKNAHRASLIADCAILCTVSIGGPAAARVVRAGVHPIKYPDGDNARDVLQQLQSVLEHPPIWLARRQAAS